MGGGLAGSALTILYNRRLGRLQRILLIERVNELVAPGLEGITLARRHGGYDSHSTQLEPVKDVREYQLTLRNSSNTHLRDVEIQFEFADEDVIARTQRPFLSKTPLEPVDAAPAEPWKKAFRWRIPHFPVGDSVEFTFQAVESSTGDYEAVLYNADRVIVQKVAGEPARTEATFSLSAFAAALLIGFLVSLFVYWRVAANRSTATSDQNPPVAFQKFRIAPNGCMLTVTSTYKEYQQGNNAVFYVRTDIDNDGEQPCTIQVGNEGQPFGIRPGDTRTWRSTVNERPKLADKEIFAGSDASRLKSTSVRMF